LTAARLLKFLATRLLQSLTTACHLRLPSKLLFSFAALHKFPGFCKESAGFSE
jgi:hypothetical protein